MVSSIKNQKDFARDKNENDFRCLTRLNEKFQINEQKKKNK